MKLRIGMEFQIDYAHSLRGHKKCEPKHGHTSKVLIEIEGEVKGGRLYEENVVMDFDEMRSICKRVLDELDHRDLNEIFEFPTAENVSKWIYEKLKEKLPVCKVTVFEGEGKWCTVGK
jgi:6-pyruvoyltetrahydropterin/6-carboxytetrahydropterin synthase